MSDIVLGWTWGHGCESRGFHRCTGGEGPFVDTWGEFWGSDFVCVCTPTPSSHKRKNKVRPMSFTHPWGLNNVACCYKKNSLFLALIDLQRLAIMCCMCRLGIPLPPQQPHFIYFVDKYTYWIFWDVMQNLHYFSWQNAMYFIMLNFFWFIKYLHFT